MPLFIYKATQADGTVVKGSLEADSLKGAVVKLQNRQCIPMTVKAAKENGTTGFLRSLGVSNFSRSIGTGVRTRDVMRFTLDLSALIRAGLPLDKSLRILEDTTENRHLQQVMGDILKTVQGGGYLSDALGRHPRVFSAFYVNMVSAGEAGGVLESVLERLGSFLEKAQELKDYIVSALIYPLFLVVVGGASIVLLMTVVVPKFSMLFADMGATLPVSTQILLIISNGIRSYWWLMLLIAAGVGAVLQRYAATERGRLRVDRLKLTLPFVGHVVRHVEVARFARTLGTLVKSGVPILEALKLVQRILTNRVITDGMETVYRRVKEGGHLSAPLQDVAVFPPLAVQMISVGEETGHLDDMLLQVADTYETIVRNLVKRLISLLEPVMILGMGLVVGFVVIAMLLAIFGMNDLPI
ncbi:MAG: type II secretion system protein GspF [Deltaproteobacteria bacterium]|nr:MAG: type II secretion system protein GspF [Deltaproteobacteria bacterium]